MGHTAQRHLFMSASGPTTIGVVGLGYWGPNLVRVAADLADAELRWICDLEDERLSRLARRYPATRTTNDFGDLLADERLDAILIATPVFTHVDLCTRSLLSGKHTFVEKPLATALDSADGLLVLAQEQERVLMCGHTFLYSSPVRAVRTMLEDDVLGDVLFVSSSRVNLGLHQRDISVIWDLGPHDFSILLHWLGELPTRVRAVGRDSVVRGIPDVAFITLDFPSGIVASVELSWLAPSKLRRTVVVGREKMVVYDDGAIEPVRLYDSGVTYEDPETFGTYQLSYRTGDVLSPKLDTCEPLVEEIADFVRAIRSGDRLEAQSALARDVVSVTAAAEESLRSGGAAVDIDRNGVFARAPANVSSIDAPRRRGRTTRAGAVPAAGLARPALVEEPSR
jgi:predicted dehydrogenase